MKNKRNTENDIKYLFKVTFENGETYYKTFHKDDKKMLIRNEKGWNGKNNELGIETDTRSKFVERLNDENYTIELLDKSCEKEIEELGNELIKNDPNTLSTRVGKWNPVVVKPITVKRVNRWGDVMVKTLRGTETTKVTYYINRKYGKTLGLEKYMVTTNNCPLDKTLCEVKKELKIIG